MLPGCLLLAEQPGDESIIVIVAGCPGIVSDAGEFDVDRIPTGFSQGFHGAATAVHRDCCVLVSVCDPDWQVFDGGDLCGIGGAADGGYGSKQIGPANGKVEGAKATHRESCEVDAAGVNGFLLQRELEHLLDGGQLRADFVRHDGIFFAAPVNFHPFAVAAALGCEHIAGEAAAPAGLSHLRGEVEQLQGIVAATFTGAVQEQDKRVSLAGFDDGRFQQPIVEDFVLVFATGEGDGFAFIRDRGVYWNLLFDVCLGCGADNVIAPQPAQ